ncbi:DUF4270 family protein [Chryseobacterium potabilaquae]|uniref:DUF4270 domain-containing protein n=1 Tax=Chryseobacterium potabilaquae TaxID=2675057 RepID=A0A6N4XAP5_9FLAO|nr:DUF4270 family protein [Chryseobacterium potabilaquae]CAA7197371.1 hypothetical protein CHRY9293_03429 [Chryseobacterium potabilaquae]
MTHIIKRSIAIFSMVIFGSVLLYNCEPDPDSLGEQLFLDGAATGNEEYFNLIAYNISNNDSIRSDAAQLLNTVGLTTSTAVLGAVKDDQFGKQKVSYYTQVRLPSYNPDFGTNAAVDSVVLVVKPYYEGDSLTTNTYDDGFQFGGENAKKIVSSYPAKKYGRAKAPKLTIKVNEVDEFLNGFSDIAYSNKEYATGQEIGSADFTGNVSAVTITKDSDGSSLFTSAAGYRIPLSSSFFKTKIIDKKGQSELNDMSNFIRYFKGIKLSVVEDDAYLVQFDPNALEMIMYYKYDKIENGVNTRPQATYAFSLAAGNAHIGNYKYDRSGLTGFPNVTGDTTVGDEKLFLQGMGGPSIGIKIPNEELDKLKKLYQDKKAAIVSAKIRMYTDGSWTNKYAKPSSFTIIQKDKDSGKDVSAFTTDLLNLVGANNFSLFKVYDTDKNPTYYEFTVTKSIKDLVEVTGVDNTNKLLKIDIGSFLSSSSGVLGGYQYTSRAFAVERAVFVGSSDVNNPNRIQLRVLYGTK